MKAIVAAIYGLYILRLLTDNREHDGGLNVASAGFTNVDDMNFCEYGWSQIECRPAQSSLIL